MIQLCFIVGTAFVAIAVLGGLFAPLRPRRGPRLLLGIAGVALLALGSLLFAVQEPPMPSAARILFEAFPDGTPITEERILRGDEFLAAGIRLVGAPRSGYCAEGTATAIRGAGRYGGISFNFLTAAMPDDIDKCNGSPVEISFIEPVRRVRLTFAGASQTYTLNAYEEDGALLGSSQADAVWLGGTSEIAFESEQADIARVTYGSPLSLTAIQVIEYER